jgi:hypothetical protein
VVHHIVRDSTLITVELNYTTSGLVFLAPIRKADLTIVLKRGGRWLKSVEKA